MGEDAEAGDGGAADGEVKVEVDKGNQDKIAGSMVGREGDGDCGNNTR